MRIRPWKYNFSQDILNRGKGYQFAKLIKDYRETDHEIFASVQGNALYKVYIELHNEKVTYMSCTCPYAKRGAHCKHEAAVLYEAMDHRGPLEIEELSDDDIEMIMYEYEDIYEDSVDQDGYFVTEWDDDEEDNEWCFLAFDTVDFLTYEIDELLKDHLYMTAVKVIARTYEAAHQHAYHCVEGLDKVADICGELLKKIYEEAPEMKEESLKLLRKLEDEFSAYDDESSQRIRKLIDVTK